MPLTYSGRLVNGISNTTLSLPDIGLALSRQPRFGGHTQRWWSVLAHSLFCERMARCDGKGPDLRLALLLHDAHEAATGDVPTDVKTDDLRTVQGALDHDIFRNYYQRFGGFDGYLNRVHAVGMYDRRALAAEAAYLGPPDAEAATFGSVLDSDDMMLGQMICDRPGMFSPADLALNGSAPIVQEYVRLVVELM